MSQFIPTAGWKNITIQADKLLISKCLNHRVVSRLLKFDPNTKQFLIPYGQKDCLPIEIVRLSIQSDNLGYQMLVERGVIATEEIGRLQQNARRSLCKLVVCIREV